MKSFKQFLTEQVELKPHTYYAYNHETKKVRELSADDIQNDDLQSARRSIYAKMPEPVHQHYDYNEKHTIMHLSDDAHISVHTDQSMKKLYGGHHVKAREAVKALTKLEPGVEHHLRVDLHQANYGGHAYTNFNQTAAEFTDGYK